MANRIYALDGLRGIAALMVVMWHLTGSMVDGSGWTEGIVTLTVFGRTGVDLFFVLSGFLIIGILVDQRGAANLFQVFYIRRVCRIVPPYLALILVYWLCFVLVGQSAGFNTDGGFLVQLAAQLTFTWNLLMAYTDSGLARGFSVVWSVCIEEHFYLVFPALLLLTSREKIWRLLVIVGVLSAGSRAALWILHPSNALAPYVLSPLRLDGLCAGGLIAIGVRNAIVQTMLARYKREILGAAAVAAISIPAISGLIRFDTLGQSYLWGHLYFTIAYSTILIAILFNADRVHFLRNVYLRSAGQISYSMYLFHPLFLSLFFQLAGKREIVEDWSTAALTAASFLTTIIWCLVLYRSVERPAQAFGHRYKYQQARVETVVRPAF